MAFFSALIAKMGKRGDEEAPGGGGHEQHKHQPTPSHPHPHPHRLSCFSRIWNRIDLYLRILNLAFLVAGIIVLAVNQISTVSFLDFSSFRYIFAAIIIAQTYLVVQIAFTIFRILTGMERGTIICYFDFLGDKMLSYLLATGAAAAFGAAMALEDTSSSSSIINRGKRAATLVLIAFFFSAISSIISSHTLPKHPAFNNLL